MLKINLTDGTVKIVRTLVTLDACTFAVLQDDAYTPATIETIKKYTIASIEFTERVLTEDTAK